MASTLLDSRARSGVQGDFLGSSLVASPSFQGLRPCRHLRALSNNRGRAKEFWNPAIVDELCTADILLCRAAGRPDSILGTEGPYWTQGAYAEANYLVNVQ